MSKEELAKELSDAIISCKKDNVIAAVEKARDAGMEPTEIIEKGLAAGMNEVGVLFERGKLFLPHVMMAADAMTQGVALLEKDMEPGESAKKPAVIVNGTVEGDVHDIGKSIVSTMLQSAGFEVHDIGRDMPTKAFIDKIKEVNANVVGLSALMTTTMQGQKEVIEALKEEGLRDEIKVMLGGAPVTQAWADKIGADLYAENATEAVRGVKEILNV
ncbi:dimethylamine corrinoid protein MtbC [Methanosalsum natronophilum]|uniref:Dimethylamine corrinoid protein 3 n=1 Tax=Methanosalsum natronophilum TaxID=768733 RepID=A0A424Z4L5_9EURY|nr:dimethylamine corrinoid protein MtbC [Methanosalsum natronophilum]MCS3924727.1 dimethylamine corrinoid protein [Methanosalsum natronophilum]RQD91028.1 MAG: dimethylamine corrinoid protein 3 [Methanosalsum natronophilum]